jgi:DNA polymerase-3 subunit gamma/tau
MITQIYRPQTFSEVAGQELSKSLLKSIIKNPQESPKTLIFEGEYGTGKTTCARIFAKALNCKNKTKDGDSCGKCEFCRSNIETSIFYNEFDSAMIGNVTDIKDLKDSFYFNRELGYKVIVLDEAQLMTPQAQSALLKILEDSLDGVFFLLCTTHIDKILPTIRSRSLKLKFDLVSDNELRNNIKVISENRQMELSDDIINLILDRCNGHVRDAHMMLDQYILLGEDKFKEYNKSSIDLYYKLIIASLRGDFNLVEKIIENLLHFPISVLKLDYEKVVLSIIKSGILLNNLDNTYLKIIVTYFKNKLFTLIDVLNSEIIYSMFTSDNRIQSAMFILAKDIFSIRNK